MAPRLIPALILAGFGFVIFGHFGSPPAHAQAGGVPLSTDQAIEELHWLLFDASHTAENDSRADQLWYGLRAAGLSPREIAQALVHLELDELARQGVVPGAAAQPNSEAITANVDRALAGWAVQEQEVIPPAPPPAPTVYSNDDDDWDDEVFWRVGARGVGFKPFGASLRLGLSDDENPTMIGGGAFVRVHLIPWWAIEMSTDYAVGASGNVTQSQVPVMFNFQFHPLAHLAEDSFILPYVYAGFGVQFTKLRYLNEDFTHSFVEGVFSAGVGADIVLSERVRLHSEIGLALSVKDDEWRDNLASACAKSGAAQASGLCSNVWRLDPDMAANVALQFTFGVSITF